MKLPAKHIRIGVLMIISQALLLGFTLYWLGGQYDKEKEKLVKSLTITYKASYETLLDSLLLEQYIEPALGDSSVALYSYRRPKGSITMADTLKLKLKGDSIGEIEARKNRFVTININSDDSTYQHNDISIKELEEEMLLRSVKLIVRHIDDSSMMHIRAMHGIESDIDSLMFMSDFESRIESEGIKINSIWISDDIGDEMELDENRDLLIGGWTEAVPRLSIKKYRPYIFGQILPQVLFSAVLLLLTALSFLLAFRSLRKQTMLNELRNSFISNISHELKTPVSTVKVAIEAIRNFDLKKDTKLIDEYLGMAAQEIKRLELLISKVLDNTIIEQDNSILRFETADLAEIIQAAIDSLAPKIIDAKADVIFAPEGSFKIEADPMYLQGVIINLMDNSLKYGNGDPEIRIELKKEGNNIIISVSDNGPGIPEKYISKVFDKFFRIPTSDIHNVKGYGLGLSFAALIVDMHGGTIGVNNNENGCTFRIILPSDKL